MSEIGGLATSFVLELIVYPAVYKLWKRRNINSDKIVPEAGSVIAHT